MAQLGFNTFNIKHDSHCITVFTSCLVAKQLQKLQPFKVFLSHLLKGRVSTGDWMLSLSILCCQGVRVQELGMEPSYPEWGIFVVFISCFRHRIWSQSFNRKSFFMIFTSSLCHVAWIQILDHRLSVIIHSDWKQSCAILLFAQVTSLSSHKRVEVVCILYHSLSSSHVTISLLSHKILVRS